MNIQTPIAQTTPELGKGRKWLARRAPVEHGATGMLRLQLLSLEIKLKAVDETMLAEHQKRYYAEATALLLTAAANPSPETLSWNVAYRVESLIALLLDGDQLHQEIASRLRQLAAERIPGYEQLALEYAAHYPAEKKSPPKDSVLRQFLLRILNAQHWAAEKKYLARPVRTEATKKILIMAIIAFLLVVVPYVALISATWDAGANPPKITVQKFWSLFPLYTTITTGFLGALFSRLILLQSQWSTMTIDEVYLHRDWSYLLLRASVGLGGALVVYFFLQSGLVSGALFPDLKKLAVEVTQFGSSAGAPPHAVSMILLLPSKDLALLIVWSFIAGFSEVLVSGILSNTEKQLKDAALPAKKS
jgi:hypothetical protein